MRWLMVPTFSFMILISGERLVILDGLIDSSIFLGKNWSKMTLVLSHAGYAELRR